MFLCRWRTAASCRARRELLREGSSAPSWRICFCITRSTHGWREPILTSRSSATRTTRFVTARAPRRRRRYGRSLLTALRPASWCCILRRQKIVYCKDAKRRGDFPNISFDFLGFAFRARKTMWGKGEERIFAHSFQPAASPKALTSISRTIRRWTLHHRSDKALQELAKTYNPYIQGWINYYGNFYRTQLRPTLKRIDLYVIRWARRKFKRLRHQTKGARDWFAQLLCANPKLFAHWQLCHGNGRTTGAV